MLETPEERVRLLKAGISGKDIEKLYLVYNNLKVVGNPILFDFIRTGIQETNNNPIYHKASTGYDYS